jgi:periplasmic mercuric ion binding protein
MLKIIFFGGMAFLMVMSFSACKQTTANTKEETITVWGNCGMCEKTIETALQIDGIVDAQWDRKTDLLTVVYDTLKVTNNAIHTAISNAGYDTEKLYADDSVYATLHKCCLYERRPKEGEGNVEVNESIK